MILQILTLKPRDVFKWDRVFSVGCQRKIGHCLNLWCRRRFPDTWRHFLLLYLWIFFIDFLSTKMWRLHGRMRFLLTECHHKLFCKRELADCSKPCYFFKLFFWLFFRFRFSVSFCFGFLTDYIGSTRKDVKTLYAAPFRKGSPKIYKYVCVL